MISLTTQQDVGAVRDLPFCYICGNYFESTDSNSINHGHVPPESVFNIQDRNSPLKLSTHNAQCHSPMNLDDEILSQLITLALQQNLWVDMGLS